MKRSTLLLGCALSAALLQPAPASADLTIPDWSKKASSLDLSPAALVAKAPKDEPLKVVVTRETGNGPVFDTVIASTVAEAKKLIGAAQDKDSTIAVEMAQPVRAAASKDPLRSQQWALNTLKAESAWTVSTGAGITVAVIDTGVQAGHTDFSGKILAGYDVLAPRTAPADENGHGTHVAGIIAAVAGNNRGIAGLARGARILPVRVLDARGAGDTANVAIGIRWAADHGAKIINLSLSATRADAATRSAVAYAQSRKVVVVAAAGNSGCGLFDSALNYPAAYPGVIGVGSVDTASRRSSFSTCNSSVDLAAPGSGIISTYPTSRYATLSGTSMATPYVAAAAALAMQRLGSSSTIARVESALTTSATDLGRSGRDRSFGAGLINPTRMLSRLR